MGKLVFIKDMQKKRRNLKLRWRYFYIVLSALIVIEHAVLLYMVYGK